MRKQNILIHGNGGVGKSASIATLLKPAQLEKTPNLKIRFLMSETNCLYGLEDGLAIHKVTPKEGQLTYMLIKPKVTKNNNSSIIVQNFRENFMEKSDAEAKSVRTSSSDRTHMTEYLNILNATARFKGIDWATKQIIDDGDVLTFDNNTIFVVDSLTTIVNYLVKVVKGARQATIPSDYMNVQQNLKSQIFVQFSEVMSEASFILLAHSHLGQNPDVEQPKSADVMSGKAEYIMKTYPSVFGQAMNNISQNFTETIYAWKDFGSKYYWAGEKENVDTSVRRVPRKDELTPDFSLYPIFVEEK
jgi:hypothetical protein